MSVHGVDDGACGCDELDSFVGRGVRHVLRIAPRNGPRCQVDECRSVEDVGSVTQQIGEPFQGMSSGEVDPRGDQQGLQRLLGGLLGVESGCPARRRWCS